MVILEAQAEPWYAGVTFLTGLRVLLLAGAGFPLAWLLGKWAKYGVAKKFSANQALIAGKAVFYAGVVVVLMTVLQQMGFKLTALLGTLGIAGVALAFASQTSVSNLISGLFLIVENPFSVGDAIKVGDVVGEVLSVDLLSIKLRTFDNKYVRLPNETLLKGSVTNLSRFPVRRVDVDVTVACTADLGKVKAVLEDIAEENPNCLAEPAPLIWFSSFSEGMAHILFGVWAERSDFGTVKEAIMIEIPKRFQTEGIEMPLPKLGLVSMKDTPPFSVQIEPTPPPKTKPKGRKNASRSKG